VKHSSEIKDDLIIDFNNGMLLKDISKKYNLHTTTIRKYLKENNLSARYRSRQINYNPFEDLTNQDVMYWLGFIAADGSLSENKISIQLARKDVGHLVKFNCFLDNKLTIKEIDWKLNGNLFKGSSVYFRNTEVANYLENIGIGKNKTFVLNPKIKIDRHFIRGYFDGDGSYQLVTVNNTLTGRIRIATASNMMASKIINFYLENDLYFRYYRNKARARLHEIVVSRKSDVLRLLDIFYTDANTFLDRKYYNAVQIRNSLNNYTLNSGNQHPES
jgi:hypothetical protein